MKTVIVTFLFSLCAWPALISTADEHEEDVKLNAETFSGLKLRGIGPALMSGRIADIAIDPANENTWYVAAGSGNLWKTTNAGTTWQAIFDDYPSYSIGCVTIDPHDRNTIWVGTGEAVGGRHVGYGDGVYRSRDGGQSFENVGLKETEHIAKILVDPRDAQVVYVAAQGPLWSPGGQRGLYKTEDGGQTWKPILVKGPYTGVTDIVFDSGNPDIMYAALHQRHRTVWSLINGGPESGIYKTTDAGKTWRELTRGLPDEDKGKIGLAVSPQQPHVVYATIELAGRTGGFWRSEDRGESWTKMSDYISGGTGPHYYQEIFADPHRSDVVYQANVRLGRTEDGGKTWDSVASRSKHVDNHAVAFRKSDPDFLLVGCDGGLYRSFDYARTYNFVANLPLTQFYKLGLDNDYPFYNIVGGTQDNATQLGPSRTSNVSGIRNSDWRITIGGDGHDCAIDPEDPNIIYCESQQGFLRRYDRRTGQSVDIRPQPEPGEEALRFNWDSPIHISPHMHTRIYFGSRRLHRSDDRGDSWTSVSPDLTRNQNRFQLEVMNRVWSVDALYDHDAMSHYGNITSISESPLQEDLIYVGTDDGLIQVTEDGGEHWRKVERVYGVPEYSFVNDIKADLFDVDTVYAVFDNHKRGDLRPYLAKSTDRGQTWTSLVGDLPARHIVWRFEQDHVNKDLLFVGTEFGLFFSVNGGENWIKLSGGVPNIPFRDIEIQRRENDIVGATFGRGFYVLDDYAPLRIVSEELLTNNELVLFPVRQALQYVPARPLGREKGSQGDAFFTGPNPPYGAVFTYYLRDTLKTRKQRRTEHEQQIKEQEAHTSFPGWDKIKQEEREEGPVIRLTITDEAGRVVNRVDGPATEGIQRVTWNLRYPPFTAEGERGPLAVPGTYRVTAAKRIQDVETALGQAQEFEIVATEDAGLQGQDRQSILAFQEQAGELQRAVQGAAGRAQEVLDELAKIKETLKKSRTADGQLYELARSLELKLTDVREALTGDPTRSRRSVPLPPSIADQAQNAVAGTLDNTYGPTHTQRRGYQQARDQYQALAQTLKLLLEVELSQLHDQLDAAGVAWTPGRDIPGL